MPRAKRLFALISLPLVGGANSSLAVPAFSGAEGWGAITPGGRGGAVLHVTNLNDSGPGSLRAAVGASGPRTIVFDVSGTINLTTEVAVTNPYLTIAGQTAPGHGITVAGETFSLDVNDIIVRHLRFRRGNTTRADDALGSDKTPGNIIIDHVSTSWGLDENLSVYRNKNAQGNVIPAHNVTVQWSVSSEALNPNNHAFGATWGGKGVNFHHNLFASNTGRNPSISFSHFMDFRNNVLFNWRHRSVDGAGPEAHVNMINNYYKPGPATGFSNTWQPEPELDFAIVNPEVRANPPVAGPGVAGWWYVNGNYIEGFPTITADNWVGSVVVGGDTYHGVQWDSEVQPGPGGGTMENNPQWARVTSAHTDASFPLDPRDPWDGPIPTLPMIATQSAQDAFNSVLAGAGTIRPFRDAVDVRVMSMVQTGVASFGAMSNGIIDNPSQAGGYPALTSLPAPLDTDQDGMPDAWENARGLNANSAADRNGDYDTDGFTNLEEYLNQLGAFQAVKPVVWDGGVGRYALIDNWDIAFQPSRFDTVQITTGHATVDAIDQDAGVLQVGGGGSLSQLTIASGWLNVATATMVGPNGRVSYNGGAFSSPAISLIDGGQMVLSAGGNKVLLTGALSIDVADNSKLDLNDNDAIFIATPKSVIESYVASARNEGAWNGPGITSSAAATNSATGLGVLSGAEFIALDGATFDGFTVMSSDVLVKYTWNGDTNFSGAVDFDDYVNTDVGFNTNLTGWANGDFNYSGSVNFDDYVLIDVAFNTQSGTLSRAVDYLSGDDRNIAGLDEPGVQVVVDHFNQFGVPYGAAFLAAVPEPVSIAFDAALAMPLLVRRRRRR